MAKNKGEQSDNTTSAPSAQHQPAKRLSIKQVCGAVKPWFKENRTEIGAYNKEHGSYPMCRLYGKVVKTTPGTNDFGDFVNFFGSFVGVDLRSGKSFKSGKLNLPKWLENEVDTAFSTAEQHESVLFGYDIGLIISEDSAAGYEYVAERLMEESTDIDAISALLPPITQAVKLLEKAS